MAKKTIQVVQCDSCDAHDAVREGQFEIGGGRSRKRIELDSCTACWRTITIDRWIEIARHEPASGARAAGRYIGAPEGIDDPDQMRRPGSRRYVYLRDGVESFVAANEELGVGKQALRDMARTLDRLLLVNGNIYVRSLGPTHVGRLCDDARPGDSALAALDLFFLWCLHNRWMSTKEDLLAPYRTGPQRTWHSDPFDDLINGACLRCRRAGWVTRMALGRGDDRVRFALCRRCRRRVTMAELTEIIDRH